MGGELHDGRLQHVPRPEVRDHPERDRYRQRGERPLVNAQEEQGAHQTLKHRDETRRRDESVVHRGSRDEHGVKDEIPEAELDGVREREQLAADDRVHVGWRLPLRVVSGGSVHG